jgi:hypothetical protein
MVKSKNNLLEIKVANLWVNRLIGDENLPDDGIRQGKWPDWIIRREKRPGKRYTFTTYKHYSADSPLEKSGLLGPVTIRGLATNKNHNIRKKSFKHKNIILHSFNIIFYSYKQYNQSIFVMSLKDRKIF